VEGRHFKTEITSLSHSCLFAIMLRYRKLQQNIGFLTQVSLLSCGVGSSNKI